MSDTDIESRDLQHLKGKLFSSQLQSVFKVLLTDIA